MRKLLFALLLLAGLPALAKEDVLNFFNWNNYIAPETIQRFEKQCKCKLKETYYSDNEELLAKLAAGAKGYNTMLPTTNYVEGMARAGYLQPIDKSKVPNLKNIMGRMDYGKMMGGCAAALASETGKICYLAPLINDDRY